MISPVSLDSCRWGDRSWTCSDFRVALECTSARFLLKYDDYYCCFILFPPSIILGAQWPWPPQLRPMPDADHAPTFWTQVANAYKSYSNVIFDLHNEPFPDNNQGVLMNYLLFFMTPITSSLFLSISDTTTAWTCWRDGCWVSEQGYQAVGMTSLLNTVRQTGATNVVMLGGVCYSNALGSFLQYVPSDPAGENKFSN